MAAEIQKLRITVTKTADGSREYVQVMSDDQFTVNVVLIAEQIEIRDERQGAAAFPSDAPEGERDV